MGGRGGSDLTVSFVRVLCVFDLECEHNLNSPFLYIHQNRELNQVVVRDDNILPSDKTAEKYREMNEHEMMEEIVRARRVAARILGVRLGFFGRVSTFNKTLTAKLDANVKAPFMAGLYEPAEIHEIKIMGALLHPLYQNPDRMEAAGLCTKQQYSAGFEELLDRMARHYKKKNSSPPWKTKRSCM